MKKLLITGFLVFAFLIDGKSQQQEPYDYSREFIWGINKNTAGGWIGGVVLKYGKKLNNGMLETYGLELMNVKHPKEYRHNNNGSYFIYGKVNYLYAVRLQYGRELILFKKAEEQGVEIRAVGAVGPSIGVVAPYYVNIGQAGGGNVFLTNSVPHKPSEQSFESIFGPGRLFQGLGDATIKPGLNLKAALNFEVGALKSHVTGLEIGFLIDAYTEKIELMAQAENKAIFPTAFITLYYGSRK